MKPHYLCMEEFFHVAACFMKLGVVPVFARPISEGVIFLCYALLKRHLPGLEEGSNSAYELLDWAGLRMTI